MNANPDTSPSFATVQTNPAIGERGFIDIFLPESNSTTLVPFVLAVHGGGWSSGNRQSYHWIPKRLLQHGVAVVTCSYRVQQEAKFPAAYDDMVHLLNWLKTNAAEHGLRDDGCVILGGSAGGHLVCLLSTRGLQENPKTFIPIQGVVSYCPVVDMRDQYDFEQTHGRQMTQLFLNATPDENPQAYHDASPIHFIDANTPPLWIAHGDKDTVVPVGATLDYTKMCHKHGVEVTTHIEAGASHTMTEPAATPPGPNIFLEEDQMVAFVKKQLKLIP